MENPAVLKVVVRVDPPAVTRTQLDALMDGELSAFEKDMRSRSKGIGDEPLTAIERGTLKAYLFFAYTRTT